MRLCDVPFERVAGVRVRSLNTPPIEGEVTYVYPNDELRITWDDGRVSDLKYPSMCDNEVVSGYPDRKWTEFQVIKFSFRNCENDVKMDGKDRKYLTIYKSDGLANHYGPTLTPVVEFTFFEDRLVESRIIGR